MKLRTRALLGLFAFLLLLPALASAQPATLVKDHNTTRNGGTIDPLLRTDFTALGSLVLFQADDGRHGHELWRTDGTAAGTTLLADLCPGACPSRIFWKAVAGSQMFFVADDGSHGSELWITDGTPAGTHLVVDLIPGLTGSNPFELVPLGNKVLFSTHSGVDSNIVDGELWISDGTAAGTTMVADIWPGPGPSYPAFLGKIGSVVLFSAGTFAEGRELWRTDGTTAGTSRLTDLNPGAGNFLPDQTPPFPRARYAVASGSKVFFAADDGTHGRELWASDGTAAGTVLLKDIHPSGDSNPSFLVPFGAGIVFTADDGTHGSEIWKSDGTPAGTGLLADVNAGADGSSASDLTLGGTNVWFRADDGIHGKELWSTDGTTPGTALVADLSPGTGGFWTLYPPTAYFAGHLLFYSDDGVHGVEPWTTDGTGAGTSLLGDLDSGPGSSYFFNGPSDGQISTVSGGLFYFSAYSTGSNFEVWVSDGTPAGTRMLKEINDQTTSFPVIPWVGLLPGPRSLSDLGGNLLFGADDGPAQFELRKSDGTAAGTVKVSNGTAGTIAFSPVSFLPLGGALLFSGEDGLHGSELWRTDGTSAGTFMVKDLDPATSFSNGSPQWFAPLGSKIAFAGPSNTLWTSDGTNAGTQPVGVTVGVYGAMVPKGGVLYFPGFSTGPVATGGELWRTDGTVAGTSLVLDIRPGDISSIPANLTVAGGLLFFSAESDSESRELWKSDGTPGGTAMVKAIQPGFANGVPLGGSTDDIDDLGLAWAALGSKVVFPGNDGVTGEEAWVSDGTSAGTVPLGDLFPGARGSEPRWITAAAGRVFFVADDGAHGRELWSTDGTPAGTALLADVEPGAASSLPMGLRAVGRLLLFSAWDAAHGRELWVSDGTAPGTRRVQDVAPGALCSSPMGFFASGTKVYFVANDGLAGFELWSLPKGALGSALSATKTVTGFYYAGGTVTYTIVLRNDGLTMQPDAAGAELTDVLPAGLALTAASATAGTVATNTGTRTVTWNGTLNAGATVTLTITATVQAGPPSSILANQATLAWDADADGVNEAAGGSDDPGAAGGSDPTSITAGQPLGFYTVTPCRVVDTRNTTPLAFGAKRTFNVAGSCGVPSTARAITANLTIVDGTAPGTLVVWTAGQPMPGTSNLNFKVGTVRGNNAVLSLGAGAVDALATGSGGSVQMILDVSGYFQ